MRSQGIRAALGLFTRPFSAPSASAPRLCSQARWIHNSGPQLSRPVPPPTPFVPDVETFLTLIGRELKKHASKFPTWEALFTLSSDQLRELGVEPPRARRYLLAWRTRFTQGETGPGGNFKHVENGVASLRIKTITSTVERQPGVITTRKKRIVVNVPPGETADSPDAVPVEGYTVKGTRTIVGPYAMPRRGTAASVKVTESMWEFKRPHKVDGGERRRDEVRFKRRVAERRALRAKQLG